MSSLNTILVQCFSCTAIGIALMAGASLCFADETYQQSTTDDQSQSADDQARRHRTSRASDKFSLGAGLSVFEVNYNGELELHRAAAGSRWQRGRHAVQRRSARSRVSAASRFPRPASTCSTSRPTATGRSTSPAPSDRRLRSAPQDQGRRLPGHPFMQLEEGLTTFKFNYAGEGRFTANLVDRDGRQDRIARLACSVLSRARSPSALRSRAFTS